MQADQDRVWEALKRGLGLTATVTVGDQARFTLDGTEHQGVVDAVHHPSSADEPAFVGVRTGDGLYRFVRGYDGSVAVGHHLFADVDAEEAERAWQAWLRRVFEAS
jgi:hypothetical protein